MSYPLGSVVQNANNWTETITTTGTWTCPSIAVDGFDVTNVQIEVIAGGGKSATSGGLDVNGSSGAGGGAYSKKNSLAVTPTTNYTATAGLGATAANSAGADSWFSTTGTVLAKGGLPGAANAGAVGGGGPTGTGVGDTKFKGGDGGVGALAAGGGGGGGAGSGGAGGNASGTTAGTGTATGGGNGGGSAAVGSVQGGGGGGGNGLGGASGNGARGYVVLTYNKQFSRSVATETITTSDSGTNLVTGTFEGGTTESWLSSDYTLANTTAQAHAGTRSLQLTSLGTGQRQAFTAPVVCTAGQYYEGQAWFRSAVTSRAIAITLNWFSDTGGVTFISQTTHLLVADTSSGWVQGSITGIAPPNAIRCRVGATYGNSVLNEVHYIDDVKVSPSGYARQFVGARAMSESISAPTDAVTRIYGGVRNISENVANPTDAVSRQFVGTRAITESIAAPTDAPIRQTTVNRTISESIAAPTDVVTRQFAANRTISENIAIPTDSVTRTASFNRAISENVAKPTDTVARTTAVNRAINENIAAPTDVVARLAQFNRSVVEELPGTPIPGGDTVIFAVLD